MTDDAKQARRTDPAVLRAHARGLFTVSYTHLTLPTTPYV